MGQISGVNAASITSIAGVAVANISYVGPVSAATLGLGGGGGGKEFSTGAFDNSELACAFGPGSISERGSQTLYYDSINNAIYTDSGFTTPFNGGDQYWYNQTDNQWWWIKPDGGLSDYGACG